MREVTPSTDDLLTLAELVTGRPVRWYRGGPKGEWDRGSRRISVRYGMSDAQTRSTLAHEIAHVLHDDPADCHSGQEGKADRFAAHLLIRPAPFARAEFAYGGDDDRIAEELGVTRHLVRVWKKSVSDSATGRRAD